MEKKIYLAGGCFWGLEKYMAGLDGVTRTTVGYANGIKKYPTYEEVCSGQYQFAETVEVIYTVERIHLEQILNYYYQAINPTSKNHQGNDHGIQYRTGIYYLDLSDKVIIEAVMDIWRQEHRRPLAIEVKKLENYYLAEEYHQKYLDKNPQGYCHIPPYLLLVGEESRDQNLEYRVTQKGKTEAPFENLYWNHFQDGIYVDIKNRQPLFLSTDKFASSCGWPSFSKPISDDVIRMREDHRFFQKRTEIRSRESDIHLGHVFDDGPRQLGGKRYCINSASLLFIPKDQMEQAGYAAYLKYF